MSDPKPAEPQAVPRDLEPTLAHARYYRNELAFTGGSVEVLIQRIARLEAVLGAFAEAFKEPDGGHWRRLRKVAESYSIYADDLGRDRILLRIARAALAATEGETR